MRPLSRLAALTLLLFNACYPAGDGKPPPLEELYFPTGLAFDDPKQLDPASTAKPEFLYVVNSDFDLQYRSASVISYDLNSLKNAVPKNCNQDSDCGDDTKVCDTVGDKDQDATYYCVDRDNPKPCGEPGFRSDANLVLYPGRCEPIIPTTAGFLAHTVGIGAFATDVIWHKDADS